tara:strand:- start:305 stop:733 length:429 start_codon:yes stop_codon:yes gene_type:complete
MKNLIFLLTLISFTFYGQENVETTLIQNKMTQQENSWNEGNIKNFMMHYWKSDSLSFTGKNGIQNGWQITLDNYLKSYPNKKQMGTLTFKNISIKKIDLNTITVLGEWNLSRKENIGDLSGYYSLIWQKKNNEWVIIADHSS